MKLPLFDAHNHVHLGPASPMLAATSELCGFSLMSTHPRDFPVVSRTINELSKHRPDASYVPCFGVHPWFLHEVDVSETEWLQDLEDVLENHPQAAVGEIGLDGHRYNPDTGNLSSAMEDQLRVFEAQMRIAHRYERAASVHAVQCWGPLMTLLSKLKKEQQLPRKIYFHAFGATVGFSDQLVALLGKSVDLYFGFAPVINMRSPKTADVVRKIGISRIVLETDLEDASYVSRDIVQSAKFVSEALDLPLDEVVINAWNNARRLYGI